MGLSPQDGEDGGRVVGSETRLFRNPLAGTLTLPPDSGDDPWWFHRKLPGYAPTPLHDLPRLAERLGVGRVLVKDESLRLGLPAFKMLGASWAVFRVVTEHTGVDPQGWETIEELAELLEPHRPLCLATATDGNHGRAVARMARLLGLEARIWVPADTVPARITAIEGEGAEVVVVDGHYDEAVRLAAEAASDRTLVVSDTAWEGYEQVPRWVIEGYSTIFREVDRQSEEAGLPQPDVVPVPMGVGALAAAVIGHYRRRLPGPVIIGVEPVEAACVEAALRAGRVVTIHSTFRTSMVGLNCGTASPVAFPLLAGGLDWTLSISDDWAEEAMRVYAEEGLTVGETGAATLAAMLAVHARYPELHEELGLTADSTVLLLITEGATDPANYRRVVGRAPSVTSL